MSVTQKEIVEALRRLIGEVSFTEDDAYDEIVLVNRIQDEGIAPPEGYRIVPIAKTTGIAIDEGFIPAKYRAKESL